MTSTLVLAHSGPAAIRAAQLFGQERGARTIATGGGWRGALRALTGLLRHRPTVVYLIDVGISTTFAAVVARALRRRVVVDTGDLVFELERSRGERSWLGLLLVRLGERLALAAAHHVVVRGRAHHRFLRGKSSTFVPDLAPPAAVPRDGAAIRERFELDGRFVVGLVGALRVAPRLGISYGWDLVEALPHTPASVAALIVGSGEGLDVLRRRAAELGVANRCVIAGPVPVSEIAEWIGAMDVALSTQTNDAVGSVRTTGKLPLYLACGCPVLASHVGEAPRLLGPLGWTVPYEGVVDREYPHRLAERIALWASDPAAMESRRAAARELYEAYFDPAEIAAAARRVLRRPIAVVNATAQVGGAELSMLPVLAEMVKSRRVVAFLPGDGPLAERLAAIGVEVARGFELPGTLKRASGTYGTASVPRLAFDAVRQQLSLARALRSLRPAVVYCNGFRAQVGGTLPGRAARAPVVWHVRDFGRSGPFGRAWRLLGSRTALVLANSHATATQPGLRGRKVEVIHNGIDTDLFRMRDEEPGGSLVIGMAGHFTPWKGHDRFIRLLAGLKRAVPSVEGRIAGNAIYDTEGNAGVEHEISEMARDLDVLDALKVESLSPEEMPGWYADLHVFVHCPDAPEPFGRVLAEALAVGVPVASSGGGGADEVVGPAGSIVPPGDDAALQRAVTELLEDPSRRQALSREGRDRVTRQFDERLYVSRVADRLLDFT